MAVTRDSLRSRSQAERDFYAPMTGGTEIRYAAAPTPIQSTYGSRVKDRLADIKRGPRTTAPIIKAIKTRMVKTDDPFTQIAEQKSYAPQEENQIGAQIEGLADAAQGAINEGVSQIEEIRKSSGQRKAERRAERQAELKAARDERAALRGDMKKLFARDQKRYGNTVPKGSMGSGSKPGPAVDTRTRHSVGTSQDQPKVSKFEKKETRTYRGQGSSTNKLGATTRRQGGTVKDGKKVAKDTSPAVKVTNYKDIRQKRLDAREAARQAKRVSPAVKATGIPTGKNLKAGSFGISKEGKDQAAINRGIAAAKATGIPTKPVAGSFGISEKGRKEAAKNKAMAKAKAQAAKKTSTVSTTTKQGVKRTKAQMAAAKRKASGTTSSQARAANKASMRDAARARHKAYKAAKAAGKPTARTASAQRARNKAAAKARAKAAAKRRRAKKKGKKKCDIFLKYDISLLTNNNLRHDELAEVAYFVRALREVEL